MPNNPGYRAMAIAALCRSLLNDPDVRVRCSVAKALGQIGSEEVIPTLLEALNDSHPKVRQQVALAISEICRPDLISSDLLKNLSQILKNMSENPKVQMNFNAPVSGVAGNVEGDMIVNPNPKTPAEAAQEIQELLQQLQQNNPTATEAELVHQVIQRNPTLKARLLNALKQGGTEALKVFFPFLSIPMETVRGFIEAE